jgi:hypothetical protein
MDETQKIVNIVVAQSELHPMSKVAVESLVQLIARELDPADWQGLRNAALTRLKPQDTE